MPNDMVQKLKDLLLKNQEIAVVVPANPSLDTMAAGLGLYLVIHQMGKHVSIVCPTQPTVALSSLVGIDKVTSTLVSSQGGVGGDLIVSFPYTQGETGQIEKVSYEQDEANNRLKVIVHAGEQGLAFSQADVRFEQQRQGGSTPTLIFYVGASHPETLGTLLVTDPSVATVNIDNNPENTKYGTMPIVDTRWTSVSEQIADFVTLLEPQVVVQRDAAQNLLSGISSATQDFTSPRTSYLAFEVAGILMKKGASRDTARQIVGLSKNPQGVPTNSAFFPPVPNMSQPTQQAPVAPAAPTFTQAPVQTAPQQQPAQPVQPTPFAPQHQQEPVQQPQMPPVTPPDWLTPKVYKGSTLL